MDGLFEKYLKEREGKEIIKTDKGFIVFKIEFPKCLIHDCFVSKEHRASGHGTFLANQVFEICKQAGVKTVYCRSDERANGHDLSKFSIENFGFELIEKIGSVNTYKLEVSEWAEL